MKKSITLMFALMIGLVSQLASAESEIICESGYNSADGRWSYGYYSKAVEKLNLRLKTLNPQPSQVSAPAMSIDSDGKVPVVCVTITK